MRGITDPIPTADTENSLLKRLLEEGKLVRGRFYDFLHSRWPEDLHPTSYVLPPNLTDEQKDQMIDDMIKEIFELDKANRRFRNELKKYEGPEL